MTVWNGAPYLADAIDSVVAQQTSAPWELIVVDDGSTDGSEAILRRYAAEEPRRIRVLTHPGGINRGISASRNLGITAVRGELLTFLDADDVWLPHRLEHHLRLLDRTPVAAMVYGQAERWFDPALPYVRGCSQNGKNFTPPLLPPGTRPGLLRPPDPLPWFLQDESLTPCTCAVMIRSAVAQRLHAFEAPFSGMYDDQVFYAKVALHHRILVDTEVVARYRRHADSCCAKGQGTIVQTDCRELFLLWLRGYAEQNGISLHLLTGCFAAAQ